MLFLVYNSETYHRSTSNDQVYAIEAMDTRHAIATFRSAYARFNKVPIADLDPQVDEADDRIGARIDMDGHSWDMVVIMDVEAKVVHDPHTKTFVGKFNDFFNDEFIRR